jgi:hypothetical protein
MQYKTTLSAAVLSAGLVLGSTIAGHAAAEGSIKAPEGGVQKGGVEATGEVPTWMTRACPYEDSVNCYWDAQAVGNHRGHSFYVRLMPGRKGHRIACVFYVDRPKWDYCS